MASLSHSLAAGIGHLTNLSSAAKFRLREHLRAILGTLSHWSERESQRFILFAPCLMAAGILVWFSLGAAPEAALLALPLIAALSGWVYGQSRDRTALFLTARAIAFFLGGMFLIALRTEIVAAPTVPSGFGAAEITGRIIAAEEREKDRRLTIAIATLGDLAEDERPRRVRIVWRGEPGEAQPGDLIRVRANLAPPPGPVLPGGYDFGASLAYKGIGGTGFAYHAPEILVPGGSGVQPLIERTRERIADRIMEVIPGRAGGVAAALATGKRERVAEAEVEALRDAGLAHLLAISGLHMGLVCGFFFWTLRFLLTRSETVALTMPVKKIAAAGALIGGAAYLALSGASWSAQRAFIMAGVVFAAILFDRRGISLRNAAIAALIILTLRPEAVLSAGFQMSFAAVLTLVAAFTYLEERWPREGQRTLVTKAVAFVGGLALTSFLAGLATSPFAIHHFGRYAAYGLLGNLLAMPLVTAAVMPALALSVFLMPFGLDGPILVLVGQGLETIIKIANFTADLPGAVQLVPQLSRAGLLIGGAGLLLLALLSAPWRLGGAALLLVSIPISSPLPQPDVLVSRNLRNVAIVEPDGTLSVLSKRRDRFTIEAWQQSLGQPADRSALKLIPCAGACVVMDNDITVISNRSDLLSACSSSRVVMLRARAMPGDDERCGGLLVALDEDGQAPPLALRRDSGGWLIRRVRRP